MTTIAPGDWVEVLPEHDIPAICRPGGKATRGRVESIETAYVAVHVPIGDANVDEHSQFVPYPREHLVKVSA